MDSIIYEYDAFISYRHTEPDIIFAKKLLDALERYRVPNSILKNNNTKLIGKAFRDREELPTTTDLSESIIQALKHSKYLIVICSPRTPESQWIKKEIEIFKNFHGAERIQALLIEGEPEESFPEPLFYEKKVEISSDRTTNEIVKKLELLAADIRPDELKNKDRLAYGLSKDIDRKLISKAEKLLKTERLRCLAPMVNCKFDELYQRHLRRTMQNVIVSVSVIALLFGLFTSYALYMNKRLAQQRDIAVFQGNEAKRQAAIAQSNEKKANEYSKEADSQRRDAIYQSNIARENERQAITNLNEAKMQEAFALANKKLANVNEQRAINAKLLAEESENNAIVQRDQALRNQSLVLTSLASQQVQLGDRMLGMMLALQALPKNLSHPDRPIVNEVFQPLQETLSAKKFGGRERLYHPKQVLSAKFSPDSKEIVTTCVDDNVRIWDLENGMSKIALGIPHANNAMFSPDSTKILVSTYDNELYLINARNYKQIFYCKYQEDFANVSFSQEGQHILTVGKQKIVVQGEYRYDLIVARMLNVENGTQISCMTKQIDINRDFIVSAFSSDGENVIIAINWGSNVEPDIFLWNLRSQIEVYKIEGLKMGIKCLSFSPYGGMLAAALYDGTLHIFNANSGQELRCITGHEDFIEDLAFSQDGKEIITGAGDYTSRIWDVETGKMLHEWSHEGMVEKVAISNDGNYVVTGDHLMNLSVWNTYDGLQEKKLEWNEDSSPEFYRNLEFSKNDHYLLLSSTSNIINVWDVPEHRESASFENISIIGDVEQYPKGLLTSSSINFSKDIDSNLKNTIAKDFETKYVDKIMQDPTETLHETFINKYFPIDGYQGVTSADLSSDGKYLVTASGDRIVRLWDASTGKVILQTNELPGVAIEKVFFSENNKQVVTIIRDSYGYATMHSIAIWNIDLQYIIDEANRILNGRQLTEEEYVRLLGLK
jgi:WD40 repeat protein